MESPLCYEPTMFHTEPPHFHRAMHGSRPPEAALAAACREMAAILRHIRIDCREFN